MTSPLTNDEQARLVAAIQRAEKETSGEIVVLLRKKISRDPLKDAIAYFRKNGLDKTKDRNGVLVLVGYKSRRITVLGDQGINEKVPDHFWDSVIELMVARIKDNDMIGGLEAGILEIGTKLKEYFPYQKDDVNELPDAIRIEN